MSDVSMMYLGYTEHEARTIQAMRERGFAVAVFSPQELMGVDRVLAERQMVEYCNEMIDAFCLNEMEKWPGCAK